MSGFRLLAYTDADQLGGAESVLASLLAGLPPEIEVAAVGTSAEVLDMLAQARPGIEVELLPPVASKLHLLNACRHLAAVRRRRPDVVHVNLQAPWAGGWGLLGGLLARVPTVAVEHTVLPLSSSLQRRLRRPLIKRLAAHVSVGVKAARQLERQLRLPPGSIESIHNGVDDVELEPAPRAFDGPVVGTVSRLVPVKGLDVLIRALAELPGAAAVLISDGPERERLEELAEQLGIADRVRFEGWVREPRNYLPSFDVVALPSLTEAFPLVVIEAMLAERPVVASDVGSVSEEIVDGETGALVAPGDHQALAAALRPLLGDPQRRAEMGRRARRLALQRFTTSGMVERYEQLYDRILAE